MPTRKPDEPPKGAPAWQSTFADLMNLLLCFFVLLFSMSSVDAAKYEEVAASFSQTFSIFTAGSTALGDGSLVGNGVSQLNNLDDYVNDTGYQSTEESNADEYTESETESTLEDAQNTVERAQLAESENLSEMLAEAMAEAGITNDVDMTVTANYLQMTISGSLLFDSGSAEIRSDSKPIVQKLAAILNRYASNTIEIEGHTDNVPISNSKYANNDELSSARALAVF